MQKLKELLGADYAFGQGKAFKNKWVKKEGDMILRIVDHIVDSTQIELNHIKSFGKFASEEFAKDLKRRQLVEKNFVFIILV